MKHLNNLILASSSHARKQLLADTGLKFEIKTIDFKEEFPKSLSIDKVAEYLAINKNKACRARFKKGTIITADTVVIFSNLILGKPKDINEAKKFLKMLSGKIHGVISGVCVSSEDKTVHFSSKTEVKFRKLYNDEIDHYVDNYSPMDKAGGYGIQEWIGLISVEWIKGSYYNVVGLPVEALYKVLKEEF